MTEDRDPTVADALRRLDVPDHGPGFWDRLEANLAAPPEQAHAAHPGPAGGSDAEVVELGDASSRRRRGVDLSRWPLLVAAAAVVVALLAGLALLRPGTGDESQVDSAGEADDRSGADTTSPDTTEPATTEPATTETSVPERPSVAVAEETAAEWLGLLREGETEAAHAMLDEPSRAAMPLADFEQVASGLAEGAGAFADLEPISFGVATDDGTEATVVVFAGDVEREGTIETAAYPVVVTDDAGAAAVSFSFAGPPLELDEPAPGETRTSPVEVDVWDGQGWFSIDGGDAEPMEESPTSIDVEGLAGGGTHVVTIVATDGELFTSRSVTVVVP